MRKRRKVRGADVEGFGLNEWKELQRRDTNGRRKRKEKLTAKCGRGRRKLERLKRDGNERKREREGWGGKRGERCYEKGIGEGSMEEERYILMDR